jgi:hypothetical protein
MEEKNLSLLFDGRMPGLNDITDSKIDVGGVGVAEPDEVATEQGAYSFDEYLSMISHNSAFQDAAVVLKPLTEAQQEESLLGRGLSAVGNLLGGGGSADIE